MEIISSRTEKMPIRAAMFDFDGTLSLIRAGWPQIMAAVMLDALRAAPRAESDGALAAAVAALIARTTGQPTILQMVALADAVAARGGTPDNPENYKARYLSALMKTVNARNTALETGARSPASLMVPGATAFLGALHARGVPCYLASGTDEIAVRHEAALLGIGHFFVDIFGARDDENHVPKPAVITRMLMEHNLRGAEIVSFGDGPLEISAAKAVGGLAIGVACDESTGRGLDATKRESLIAAGADIVTIDFSPVDDLLKLLGV